MNRVNLSLMLIVCCMLCMSCSYSTENEEGIDLDALKRALWCRYSYEQGDFQEVINGCKEAISLDPDYVDAYLYLGHAYSKLVMHKEAIEAYKQAIRIRPNDADSYCRLGSAYIASGKNKEGIQTYKQAIMIKSDSGMVYYDAGARLCFGIAYLRLNDTGSALEQYKILQTSDPEKANELFKLIYP